MMVYSRTKQNKDVTAMYLIRRARTCNDVWLFKSLEDRKLVMLDLWTQMSEEQKPACSAPTSPRYINLWNCAATFLSELHAASCAAGGNQECGFAPSTEDIVTLKKGDQIDANSKRDDRYS
jgi:hypothetical protein